MRLAEAVTAHGSEALVLSAGWDAHRDDPLSKLAVSTDAYARIGELYGRLGLPTLIVQEGGYSLAGNRRRLACVCRGVSLDPRHASLMRRMDCAASACEAKVTITSHVPD